MRTNIILFITFLFMSTISYAENKKETLVLIETNMGNIKIKLYDETPLHRDNFVKLVENGFYDSLQFHRVIKDFMIQGGDPESKNAPAEKQLGAGGPGYNIPAEFVYPKYFHKRGALSAARQGDQMNPKKESSGSQFYIVWGTPCDNAQLESFEQNLLQKNRQKRFQQLAEARQSEIRELYEKQDQEGLSKLQNELIAQVESTEDPNVAKFTPEQRKVYSELGGTPFLDNDYTVFGEVVEGLDIVGKIQSVETMPGDKPKEPVLMKMRIVR